MNPNIEHKLYQAAEEGDLASVRALLEVGTDPSALVEVGHSWLHGQETALHAAARARHVEVCQALLDAGADIHARQENDYLDEDEPTNTPLHAAIEGYNHPRELETYQLLLERGANPNAPGSSGETPLHKVAFSESEFIEPLLKHGGDLTLKNDEGLTPLGIAVGGGCDVEKCQRWVDWGCDPKAFDIKALFNITPNIGSLKWLADLRGESFKEWLLTYY